MGNHMLLQLLSKRKPSAFLNFGRTPVVFQGDLVDIAASYLRENDVIYVSGHISAESPEMSVGNIQASIQVMACDLKFVERSSPVNNSDPSDKKNQNTSFSGRTHRLCNEEDLWNDLILHCQDWYDNRNKKRNPKAPDFIHKETRESLWISISTPWRVLSALENPALLDEQSGKSHRPLSKEDLWSDLFLYPKSWYDYRNEKKNPKYPDFRHKETGEVLWIIDPATPPSVLSRLENPAFFGERSGFQSGNSILSSKRKALWDDLVTNPQDWWDKREEKRTPKHPDFVHKESKESLWIRKSTPPEILLALENSDFFKKPGSF